MRKKTAGHRIRAAGHNRALTSAQCPRASPSPEREHSPILFTQHDQRASAAVSGMISFSAIDVKMDESLSLVASNAKELSDSVNDPALLPSSASRNARLRADEELRLSTSSGSNGLRLRVSPRVPSGPPPTLVPLLPRSS